METLPNELLTSLSANYVDHTMIVAHISYSSSVTAAWVRLIKALENEGTDCKLYTYETNLDFAVRPKSESYLDLLYQRIRRKLFFQIHSLEKGSTPFTENLFSTSLVKKFDIEADIIHLNWIADRFVSLESLSQIKSPIVWTLHDVWPLTGGCHCNLGCEKWENGCNFCEQINSSVSAVLWNKKLQAIAKIGRLTIVTPSKWLGEMAKKSPIFKNKRIEIIPNCIDTSVFKPIGRSEARRRFSIPLDKKVIIFGAVNALKIAYKGFELLFDALKSLKKREYENIHLVVFGASEEDASAFHLPFEATFLGNIDNENDLVTAYNCADVYAGPSRQDNLPGTFIEAASCGIPSVGFGIGGIPEICIHRETGYIARPFEVEDFAEGIAWVLENQERWTNLSANARRKSLSDYSMSVIARKYLAVYSSIV